MKDLQKKIEFWTMIEGICYGAIAILGLSIIVLLVLINNIEL
jgi:hypothetical protein